MGHFPAAEDGGLSIFRIETKFCKTVFHPENRKYNLGKKTS